MLENTSHLYSKARIVPEQPLHVVQSWLVAGLRDFKAHLPVSLAYGLGFMVLGWLVVYALQVFDLSWMILPAIAGAMLLGPMVAVGLYRISRRAQGQGGAGVASPRQITLVSIVMMAFALLWIRAATLLFAVFFGLRPFVGFMETLTTLLETKEGIALVLVGSVVGGLFAALGFAVSVFSFPMLISRDIDGFSAMGLSFNATTQNFWLMVTWAAVVTVLVGLCIVTGLVAAIPIFPILGYATWHAYCDLFEGGGNDV